MVKEKIGVIGSGTVGRTLALGFDKHGYETMIGARRPEKVNTFRNQERPNIAVGTFEEAAVFGEIIVLAVKGTAAKDVARTLKNDLEGKIVIDATNPIADMPPEDGVLRYFTSLERSLMEDLQEIVPKAKIVKAFNTVSSHNMVNPDFGDDIPSMMICGNDEDAKKRVGEIVNEFGFEPEDFGSVKGARALEPFVMLFCIPGFLRNSWTHGFKMLHR
jgi:hypothetical protein